MVGRNDQARKEERGGEGIGGGRTRRKERAEEDNHHTQSPHTQPTHTHTNSARGTRATESSHIIQQRRDRSQQRPLRITGGIRQRSRVRFPRENLEVREFPGKELGDKQHPGYTLINNINRQSRVAVYVRKDRQKEWVISKNSSSAVQCHNVNSDTKISGVYIPPTQASTTLRNIMEGLIEEAGPDAIMGDFNTKHQSWGPDKTSHRGKHLRTIIDGLGWTPLLDNRNEPT